jgi:TPR repeat protein
MCLAASATAGALRDETAVFDPDDYATEYRLTLPAAEKGDASAQYNIGLLHHDGLGVAQNFVEAAKWFQKSAEQNFAEAQFSLGNMYRYGRGVPKDYAQAYMWFSLSASGGHKNASKSRDFLKGQMTSAQILTAYKLEREWKRK